MTVYSKSPENFATARLFAADFDGTIADTFTPSPNEVDVHRAYDIAVGNVFTSAELQQYRDDGGLQNRAPSEIVSSLRPSDDVEEHAGLTDALVSAKLDILLNEITTQWPRPIPGYLETQEALQKGADEGLQIDEAIVSSGHVPFIEKTFETWGVPVPKYIVAVETIRDIALSLSIEPPVKPNPSLMQMVHQLWHTDYGVHRPDETEGLRTIYVGDDNDKDGMLAQNSGTDFVLINPTKPAESWRHVRAKLNIGEEAR